MLKVSRSDINTESLVEFDKPFLRLPIDKYMQMLRISGKVAWDEINAPQIALINAINDPSYRFVVAALSRRLGKTTIANIIGQMTLLVPGSNVLVMSPNYSLSLISFEMQRNFVNQFDLEIARDNLKDKVLELSNGSTIRVGSVNQVDSCVGRSYDLIIFDEAALSSDGESAFNVSLRPTLDKVGSKAIFISTPRGKKNWFSRFYSRGYSDDFPEWVAIHADWTENTRMSVRDVDEARKSMSAAEFEQEYLASFNSYEGQIFALSEENIVDELPEGNYEFFAGLDPGYKDPTAFVVFAYDLENEIYYIVDDYLMAEKTTAMHAASLNELIAKWNIDAIFIDSAAAQMASDLAFSYDIATIKAKKEVLEGIAYVQTLVQQDKIKVLRRCNHVLDAMDQYQWDPNENLIKEKPLHNEFSHIADAMRYGLYTFTP